MVRGGGGAVCVGGVEGECGGLEVNLPPPHPDTYRLFFVIPIQTEYVNNCCSFHGIADKPHGSVVEECWVCPSCRVCGRASTLSAFRSGGETEVAHTHSAATWSSTLSGARSGSARNASDGMKVPASTNSVTLHTESNTFKSGGAKGPVAKFTR